MKGYIVTAVVILILIAGSVILFNSLESEDDTQETDKDDITVDDSNGVSEEDVSGDEVTAPIDVTEENVPSDEVTAPIYLSNIEATVISIELDELENDDCGILFQTSTICPRDKAVIRIDSFENIDDPDLQILEVGSEITVYFEYSARFTRLLKDRKLICEGLDGYGCSPPGGYYSITKPSSPDEKCVYIIPNVKEFDCDSISIELEDKPTEIDEGFIVYHFSEDYHKFENDIILSGIEVGGQIKFTSSVMTEEFTALTHEDSQIYDIETYEPITISN